MPDVPALDSAVVRWSDAAEDAPLVVLLHGYGADEHDLFGLTPHLPAEFAYAAVRAPLTSPWPAPGFSWYPIEGLHGRSPEAMTPAVERLSTWLDEVAPDREIGLLGFSQGGAIALHAMRTAPERYSFVVNLAGYAAPGPLPGDATLAEHPIPVFWGRGALDTVIPAELVDHTARWLPGHSDLSGRVYEDVAHGLSAEELSDVARFLGAQLHVARPGRVSGDGGRMRG